MRWSGPASRRPDRPREPAGRTPDPVGRRRGAHGIALFLAATAAFAQSAWQDAGDYVRDLDKVYDAILAVRYVSEVCAQSFPEFAAENARAYERWRARFATFHREIERHHAERLKREAALDPARAAGVGRRWDESDRHFRETLAMQLLVEGPEVFRGECRVYPKYLASEDADFERHLSAQVASIRRGPR